MSNLPFNNFDALLKLSSEHEPLVAVRGVGRGALSHEYWVLFQIIHHVVIRYSTKATLLTQLTTEKKIKVTKKIYPTVTSRYHYVWAAVG